MKICCLTALIMGVSAAFLSAESGADLPSSIGKLRSTLQAVQGLKSVSASSYAMLPVYYEINKVTPAERPGHTVNKTLILAGSAYRISEKTVSKNGDLYLDNEVAYDGRLLQKLDHVNGSLSIWEKTKIEDLLNSRATPLDQFGFLAGFTPSRSLAIGLKDLKSDTLWAQVLARAKFLGVGKLNGKNVVSFEINDAFDPTGNIPCRYEVDLSPSHGFFPMRWAAYNSKGECFQEFVVTEFGKASFEGISFYYPLAAEGKFFAINKYRGQPMTDRTWKTESLEITPIDDEVFTIDPSSAREVVDQNTQTAVAVPK